MSRPPNAKKAPDLPPWLTAAQCAQLAGISERRFYELTEQGKVPKAETPGEFPAAGTIRALFDYYRELANGLPAQTAADRARQAKADADTAELNAAKSAGKTMFTADARRLWAAGLVAIREAILKYPMNVKTKRDLADAISKVRIHED